MLNVVDYSGYSFIIKRFPTNNEPSVPRQCKWRD